MISLTARTPSLRLFTLCLMGLGAIGCGDDGDSKKEATSYEPSTQGAASDGSAGGDLIALQIRQSEVACECAEDAELVDFCIEFAWPEGQAECMRDAINARAAQNTEALACTEKAVREAIDCLTQAGCDQDAQGACQVDFSEEQQKCPQLDAQTQSAGQACVNTTIDDCANADICDGWQDCADGSDEANCE